jgi:hypothetical protein
MYKEYTDIWHNSKTRKSDIFFYERVIRVYQSCWSRSDVLCSKKNPYYFEEL